MVSHKDIECFNEASEKMKVENGIFTQAMFHRLCNLEGGRFGGKKLKKYLLALGVAVEMKNNAIFILCLVSDLQQVYECIIMKVIQHN